MNGRSLAAVIGCVAFACAAAPVAAQFKPSKPIEIIVHTGPGGGGDVLARFISQAVEKEKLAPVRMQVNNKPGGGGLTAMNFVVEKKGDAHAIAVFTGVWLTNPLTQSEAKATVKDMTPVVRLVGSPGTELEFAL